MKSLPILTLLLISNLALADQSFTTPFDGRLLLAKQVSNDPTNPWATQGIAGYDLSSAPAMWRFSQGNNYLALEPELFLPSESTWTLANANNRLKFWKSFQGYSNVYEIAYASDSCREPEWDSEVDLFLDPIGTPSLATLSLADIGELRLKIGYINTQSSKTEGCSVTRSTAITSLYINDIAEQKTLSLQINLGGTEDASNNYTGFTWGGNTGIDDNINNYGGNYLKDTGNVTNTVDLLPRVINFIQSGAAGGSTDPKNWFLSGFNLGVISFGKVNISTNWHSVELNSLGGSFCGGTTKTQYICTQPTGTGWNDAGAGCYHRPTNISC